MKEWEVWTEGYAVQEGRSPAKFHGVFEGDTFKDAVRAFKETLTDDYSKKCVDLQRLTFWGCRFFDNHKDASKSFG